jgi:hypothetical protein
VYEDMDHEWLYEPDADGIDEDPAFAHMGIALMGIKDWFTPSTKVGTSIRTLRTRTRRKSRQRTSRSNHRPLDSQAGPANGAEDGGKPDQ